MIATTSRNPFTPVLNFLKWTLLIMVVLAVIWFIFNDTLTCELQPKRDAGAVANLEDAKCLCSAKTAGHYNDKFDERTFCCPTGNHIRALGKQFCADLPTGGRCSFNGQCDSNICHPENTQDAVCLNSMP